MLWNRPKTRGDCKQGERPCPWVGCVYHLGPERAGFKDILMKEKISRREMNLFIEELEAMPETCTLDVADRGGSRLRVVADIFNTSRERVRQIEYSRSGGAIRRLRHPKRRGYLKDFID